MECWLRPNRRALGLACVAWGGASLAAVWWATQAGLGRGGMLLAWLLAVVTLGGLASTLWTLRTPRTAYADGNLWLFLRGTARARIPIDVVECFFLGQGPSGVHSGRSGDQLESRNVVVRIAERATQWHHGDLPPALGHWCEGYITLTGTWCEPIDGDLVARMNQRLTEVKRQHKIAAPNSVATP